MGLNSLRGRYMVNYIGEYYRGYYVSGTRSLGYSSNDSKAAVQPAYPESCPRAPSLHIPRGPRTQMIGF